MEADEGYQYVSIQVILCKERRETCVKLPPCQTSLKQHCLRANCQSEIWRDCITDEFFVPTPEGHGWAITDGEISIKWMDC